MYLFVCTAKSSKAPKFRPWLISELAIVLSCDLYLTIILKQVLNYITHPESPVTNWRYLFYWMGDNAIKCSHPSYIGYIIIPGFTSI